MGGPAGGLGSRFGGGESVGMGIGEGECKKECEDGGRVAGTGILSWSDQYCESDRRDADEVEIETMLIQTDFVSVG